MAHLFDKNIIILSDRYGQSKYKNEINEAIQCAKIAKMKVEMIEKSSCMSRIRMCDDFACEFVCPVETNLIIDVLEKLANE